MNLLTLHDLTPDDIRSIWQGADTPVADAARPRGHVAWSFEGSGIRTRSSFLQAFRALGLDVTELPGLLKSSERAVDLAGYLDPWYDLYVVRESNHARLAEFAQASRRPVINAMSSHGHPCEVLTDAHWIDRQLGPIERVRVGLWGAPTNVLSSWHELAAVLGLTVHHFCDARLHVERPGVSFHAEADTPVDIVITDAWAADTEWPAWRLSHAHLAQLGDPWLLPTPPYRIDRELALDPLSTPRFVGHAQKRGLVEVQRAIVQHLLARTSG